MTDWLPPHQQHLQFTLAHVDEVIDRMGDILFEYLRSDPFELSNRSRDGRSEVLIVGIRPLPEVVPRLAVDALNQLRSAVEHALFAEVEHEEQRPLEAAEAQAIEMPIKVDRSGLAEWHLHKRRRTLPTLHADGKLGRRIRQLQPSEAADPQVHPLKLLAEHSNLAKHRMPAVAAVRIGMVNPDFRVLGLELNSRYEDERPVQVGDVLASVPEGVIVPLDIWPKVAIRRPHLGTWEVVVRELGSIETWVREEALPTIIVGSTDVPPIRPQLNTSRGYARYADASAAAGEVPAAVRHQMRFAGQSARNDLPAIFMQALPHTEKVRVEDFVSELSDQDAIEIVNRMNRVRSSRGEASMVEYLRRRILSGDKG